MTDLDFSTTQVAIALASALAAACYAIFRTGWRLRA